MKFDDWEPAYEAILADFGYERSADERARDHLADLVEPFDLDRLSMDGATVAIAGGASTLSREFDRVRAADVVVAASNAARRCRDAGLQVDVMVTDLDKTPETARELAATGVPVAIHAHGDNIPALREYVPQFDTAFVLGTTQAAPSPPVQNLGGFTDGDRAAFLADHCGAARLVFPGWAFDDPTVGADKRRKLAWAERLLHWLEHRRGERFEVLDGRRGAIELGRWAG